MTTFKAFDVYSGTLKSINDIGKKLQKDLNKKYFIANQHLGKSLTVSNSNLVKSLTVEGCMTPVILWVNPESNNGFNTKTGKTRIQIYQAFHEMFDLPVVIIDPYRSSESKKLIADSFPTVALTEENYNFVLKYIPKKDTHEFFPIFNNLTNKDISAKLNSEYEYKDKFLQRYLTTQIPGEPGLKILQNEEIIYRLGDQKNSIN